mgnify:CR=1 FL=1
MAVALSVTVFAAYGGASVEVYSSLGRITTSKASYPAARIRKLIWPTIGYPAWVAPGGAVEVELALGDAVANDPGGVGGWEAVLRPSRRLLNPVGYRLIEGGASKGPSKRWPAGTLYGGQEVWRALFTVPSGVPPELYDITVRAAAGAGWVEETQRHAVSVTDRIGNDFTYVTLADIHVHRRNISAFMQRQTDRGISREGRPVYFEDAITQVNLIRPDFAVLLGDFVRAQHQPGDYQIEFANFYRALQLFEVPVFTVPGNHDCYVNEVDGARVFETNLGPLFYSFNFGDCHFTVANTSDWPLSERIVMEKFGGAFVYPAKWQGQIRGAKGSLEGNPDSYLGQLRFLRDDLDLNRAAPLRVMLMHHDPYIPGGKGEAFDNERFGLVFSLGGGGMGRSALQLLASRYRVNMVMCGHVHLDRVEEVAWEAGAEEGETRYVDQTCVYFDQGGRQPKYPGYRLVKVRNGRVEDFSYVDGYHSVPFFDGSNLQGESDTDLLCRPALEGPVDWREEKGLEGNAGRGVRVTLEYRSYLEEPVELRGVVVPVPAAESYAVEGGEIYRVVPLPSTPDTLLLYIRTALQAGRPGPSPRVPGTAARTRIVIYGSGVP